MKMSDIQAELNAARETNKDLNEKISQIMREERRPFGESNANLYLALDSAPVPKRSWQRLIRYLSPYSLFKLKPFGEPLDPMSRSALYYAAGLLCAIFLMEFVGWSLLFNEVLNAGVLKWSALSIPAMYFGLLFAFGIIALEQAILTADTTRGWGKRKGTLTIRVLLIGCSALITTQPYELLFFSSEVKDRVHQESTREEMALRYAEYGQLNMVPSAQSPPLPLAQDSTRARGKAAGSVWIQEADRSCPAAGAVQAPVLQRQADESQDVFDARTRQELRNLLARNQDGCAAALRGIADRVKVIDQQIHENRKAIVDRGCDQRPEREGCSGLTNRFNRLQTERGNTEAARGRYDLQRTAYEIRLQREFGQLPSAPGVTSPHDDEIPATPDMIIRRRTQLKRYMDRLVLSKPGEKILLEGYRSAPPTEFRDREYGVTNKVRVLYSELSGAPYQWPAISKQLKGSIIREFPLSDPESGVHWYRWIPWGAVLLAAMFLPFISLGYKLTLNDNLNLYYVTEYQQQLGHVGATVATQAARRFRERREEVQNNQNEEHPQKRDASARAPFQNVTRDVGADGSEPQLPTSVFPGDAGNNARTPSSTASELPGSASAYNAPRNGKSDEPRERTSNEDGEPPTDWRGRSRNPMPGRDQRSRDAAAEGTFAGHPSKYGDGADQGSDPAADQHSENLDI